MRRILLLAALLAVAGCATSPIEAAGPAATTARVGLVDFDIVTSAAALADGPVTLQVTNTGATAHDLRIEGAQADAATKLLAPGEQATLAVDLTGETTVQLWCTVPGHRAQGMERQMAVRS